MNAKWDIIRYALSIGSSDLFYMGIQSGCCDTLMVVPNLSSIIGYRGCAIPRVPRHYCLFFTKVSDLIYLCANWSKSENMVKCGNHWKSENKGLAYFAKHRHNYLHVHFIPQKITPYVFKSLSSLTFYATFDHSSYSKY
jgi:hypothetical protein